RPSAAAAAPLAMGPPTADAGSAPTDAGSAPTDAAGITAAAAALVLNDDRQPQLEQLQQQQQEAATSEEGGSDAGTRASDLQYNTSMAPPASTSAAAANTESARSKKAAQQLAKFEAEDGLDELLAGVYDNEEELVARLVAQLQGLSHKQQRMYGIFDGTEEGGKRAFVRHWRQRHAERRAMMAALFDPAVDPKDRMALRTGYILRWRKILFSCPNCWLLPGLCVCARMQRFSPRRTQVVVHAHHGEWGSASNSGTILPTSLEGSEILLYGHPEHDTRLQELLADTTRTTALLWPGGGRPHTPGAAKAAEQRIF
ncbi:hypothetical protein TSOC_006074, partial [Tetrabaena socialis]